MQVNITIKNIQGSGESKLLYAILMKDYIHERKGCYISKEDLAEQVADIYEGELGDQVIGLPLTYLREVEALFKKLNLRADLKLWVFDDSGMMLVRGYTKTI